MAEATPNEIDVTIEEMVHDAAGAALDLKASNIKAFDVRGLVSYTDYFLICSGRSDRQVIAIAKNIINALREKDHQPIGLEGFQHGMWVLVDYGDIVVHVFHENEREEYNIERLWSEAPSLELDMDKIKAVRPADAPLN